MGFHVSLGSVGLGCFRQRVSGWGHGYGASVQDFLVRPLVLAFIFVNAFGFPSACIRQCAEIVDLMCLHRDGTRICFCSK